MSLSVACIGLGRTGSGIARNIQNAGFPLTVYNRTVEKAAAEVHAPLSYASVVRDKCLAAQARGMGQLDWSAMTESSRLDAGQKIARR